MADPILQKFAQTLVQYSLDTQPGDVFLVRTTLLGEPLLREVYREALRAGAHVLTRLSFDGQEEMFLQLAGDAQLDWVSPIARAESEHLTARLSIHAPYNTRSGADVDAGRQ